MCTHNQILANGFKLTNTTNISRRFDHPARSLACPLAMKYKIIAEVVAVVVDIDSSECEG